MEGHGAILVLTRAPHALKATVEIKVHKALTEDDYKSWRYAVSKGLRNKQMDVLVDALSEGFDVNSVGVDGWYNDRGYMAQIAAENGFAEAVRLLLEMGADPDLVKGHVHVLSSAAESGHVPTLKAYLDHEDKTGYRMEDEDYAYAISQAAGENKLETLKVLLEERGDRVDRNGKWFSRCWGNSHALESGSKAGNVDCIRLLVESNKMPESARDRAYILCNAAEGGQLEMIKYLVTNAHWDPNGENDDGERALLVAIKRGGSDEDVHSVVKWLLDNGALPNFKGGAFGETPLHLAAGRQFVSTTKLLLDRGADPSMESGNKPGGSNVFEACLYRNNSEIQSMLVSVRLTDREAQKKYYNRLLFCTCRNGDRALVVQVLKEADIDAINEATGDTPLLAAIAETQLPMARMLVRKGARQKVKNTEGKSPLQLAAEKDMDLLIQDLAKAKDSPGIENPDKEGNTLLMIATKARHQQAVSALLRLGADRDAMNDYGETALDIAEESRNDNLIAILKGEQ